MCDLSYIRGQALQNWAESMMFSNHSAEKTEFIWTYNTSTMTKKVKLFVPIKIIYRQKDKQHLVVPARNACGVILHPTWINSK